LQVFVARRLLADTQRFPSVTGEPSTYDIGTIAIIQDVQACTEKYSALNGVIPVLGYSAETGCWGSAAPCADLAIEHRQKAVPAEKKRFDRRYEPGFDALLTPHFILEYIFYETDSLLTLK